MEKYCLIFGSFHNAINIYLSFLDVGKTSTMAPAKKTVPSTISRSAASKPSNSEAPKPAAATKQPPPSIKAPQLKPDDKKSVPTRKVPSSPRNNASRPASGKTLQHLPVTNSQVAWSVQSFSQLNQHSLSKESQMIKNLKQNLMIKNLQQNLMIKNLQQNLRNFQQLQ